MLAHEQVGLVLVDVVRLLGAVFASSGVQELQDERPLRHQDAGDEDLQLLQTRDLNLERKEFVLDQHFSFGSLYSFSLIDRQIEKKLGVYFQRTKFNSMVSLIHLQEI